MGGEREGLGLRQCGRGEGAGAGSRLWREADIAGRAAWCSRRSASFSEARELWCSCCARLPIGVRSGWFIQCVIGWRDFLSQCGERLWVRGLILVARRDRREGLAVRGDAVACACRAAGRQVSRATPSGPHARAAGACVPPKSHSQATHRSTACPPSPSRTARPAPPSSTIARVDAARLFRCPGGRNDPSRSAFPWANGKIRCLSECVGLAGLLP